MGVTTLPSPRTRPSPEGIGLRLEVTQIASMLFLLAGVFCVWRQLGDNVFEAFGITRMDVWGIATSEWTISIFAWCLPFGMFGSSVIRYYLAAWLVELQPPRPTRDHYGVTLEETVRYAALLALYTLVWVVLQNPRAISRSEELMFALVILFLIWDVLGLLATRAPVAREGNDSAHALRVTWHTRSLRWLAGDALVLLALCLWFGSSAPYLHTAERPDGVRVGATLALVALVPTLTMLYECWAERRQLWQAVRANGWSRAVVFALMGSLVAYGLWRWC